MVSFALKLAMQCIPLGKHAALTHSTHLVDKSIRPHVEKVRHYNLAIVQALAQPANFITTNENLCETTPRLLTESHLREEE